jgi:magnesium-protoporphyrin O-methyltransferase
LIEVGCGVGFFHQELLRRGASRAVGIDLSEQMLAEAKALARTHDLNERTEYRQGDFVQIASEIPEADLVILDKVICCYPDFPGLVDAATHHAKEAIAFTIPRWRWLTRAFVAAMAILEPILKFRSFVHSPSLVDEHLKAAGFSMRSQKHTTFWLSRIYKRVKTKD